ncbi:MAG: homoserine kinase [Proteobacteria bacterium]|nr:homoserine kinase [Pseudomonadota bacterium]
MPSAIIRVPATSANLGPGFDCLGLALAMHNEVRLEWGDHVHETHVTIGGEGACEISDEDNATLLSLRLGLSALNLPPAPVRLAQENRIPLARGLGSSAAAIVAGLVAARLMAGRDPLDRPWLLHNAMLIEPHPDNIAAAIYGGLTASLLIDEASVRCLPLGRPRGLRVAFAVPSYRVSTREARAVLPQQYSREDVIFSASRAAILVGALMSRSHDLLDEAVRDRIHTPARAKLIDEWGRVSEAAANAGADGVFISGSGPTVGAFVRGGASDARRVARAMTLAFASGGVKAKPLWPEIAARGVEVETH